MRYSLDSVVIIARRGSPEEVFNTFVTVFFDMRHDFVGLLVDRDANDPDFAGPLWVVLYHVVVVLHRALAGRTPGGPEVEQHDRAIVLNSRFVKRSCVCNAFQRDHLTSYTHGALDLASESPRVDSL